MKVRRGENNRRDGGGDEGRRVSECACRGEGGEKEGCGEERIEDCTQSSVDQRGNVN